MVGSLALEQTMHEWRRWRSGESSGQDVVVGMAWRTRGVLCGVRLGHLVHAGLLAGLLDELTGLGRLPSHSIATVLPTRLDVLGVACVLLDWPMSDRCALPRTLRLMHAILGPEMFMLIDRRVAGASDVFSEMAHGGDIAGLGSASLCAARHASDKRSLRCWGTRQSHGQSGTHSSCAEP